METVGGGGEGGGDDGGGDGGGGDGGGATEVVAMAVGTEEAAGHLGSVFGGLGHVSQKAAKRGLLLPLDRRGQ